jgi:hypothetical protein
MPKGNDGGFMGLVTCRMKKNVANTNLIVEEK